MTDDGLTLQDIVDALTASGDPDPWVPGITPLSLLTLEEQKEHLGVNPPPGEMTAEEAAAAAAQNQAATAAAAMAAIGAPAAYDLRNVGGKNYITEIKDQKSCGSCVAFGAVATAEGTLRVQRKDPGLAVDLSEAHLFFCHARARGRNCSTGWWPNEALDDFKSKGVADDACYPYNLSNTNCSGLCSNWADRVVKITGYQNLTNNPAKIKEWVSTRGPVSACFSVYEDFFSYKSGVYKHKTGSLAGGHCVSIVGYNDNPGYWICKNSWSKAWGDNGFFSIAYGECAIETWQNHGVEGIENTGWQNNRRVIGAWSIAEERNAWVYFDGLGWRKLSPDNDTILRIMLADLLAAKAAGRPVNFYEEQGVIKQLYVL